MKEGKFYNEISGKMKEKRKRKHFIQEFYAEMLCTANRGGHNNQARCNRAQAVLTTATTWYLERSFLFFTNYMY
jgi:uncharacterized paraquat-inducible protein A